MRGSHQHGSSSVHQTLLIAAKEFGDRFRSGWVIACVAVWLGAIALTSFLGLLQVGQIGVQGYDRTVISLLNLVQYLVPLLGLLLGHDLIVSEKEEHTLRLVLAGGVSRYRFLIGKFIGGCLTLAVPLLFGFIIAGTVIGLAAKDAGITPFLRLAFSGLVLGILFLGLGLTISVFCRTRVQSLAVALLAWCFAVFVFDLIALGCFVSTNTPAAAQEIDFVCDATHVNAAVDFHSDFDHLADPSTRSAKVSRAPSLGWLAINPIDLFRAVNLADRLELRLPGSTTLFAVTFWLAGTLGLSIWKLRRIDL
jgi:Cu-processing system permease protein